MGPITLFDKSFLQSLNVDESVWFDNFFYSVICPIFYVETLADLEKAVRQGRTPEQEVGYIADKTPEFHRNPCSYHRSLCIGNLMGHNVPMNGQIPITGGHHVKTDEGKKGLVFEESSEAQALSRWQDGKFLELEREFAKSWRRSLGNLDLLAASSSIRAMGINEKTCKSLEQAKKIADEIVSSQEPSDITKMASIFFGFSLEHEKSIIEAWSKADFRPLPIFAPYAAHVLTIEIFFQIALGSNLISTQRSSNRTDIAYLFYLPFCTIFVSSDKLHRRCAPLFMRKNQEFVWGLDLKEDLRRLNEYYSNFPEEEKVAGINSFASAPPQEGDFLVSRLWDHHFGSWRKKESHSPRMDPEAEKKLAELIERESKSRHLSPDEIDFDSNSSDFMMITQKVRRRKGSWWQIPKDLKVSDIEEKHIVMIKEARRLADNIAASLPDQIRIAALTANSKIPFKALSFRELLIHRVSALASSSIDLFERDQIIPAVILTHSTVETVTLIYALHEHLTNFLKDKNKVDLDSFLMRCLFGFHNDSRFPQSIDVLTLVDAMDKTIPKFRKMYDLITEYAYPNYSGLLGSFGKIDKVKLKLQLGHQNIQHVLINGVSVLSIVLRIFANYYNKCGEHIRYLNDFFEQDASSLKDTNT